MEVLRYTAFSSDPAGGNPAGVVLDATGARDAEMLAVAGELGYSETAFLVPRESGWFEVRYFSPLAEVLFCGHATIASAVAYADRHGEGVLRFDTPAGLVEVSTERESDGATRATLISVTPRSTEIRPADLDALLRALSWDRDDLDPELPPRVAFGGAWHPIVAAVSRERLADLDYDFDVLGKLMADRDWTTIDLVWRESADVFYARNPFPPGGVVEDPATGAAAAAFGGYLRELGLVRPPATITVHQGNDLGRPSVLTVGISDVLDTGIAVSGTAVPIDG
ncbi:MAG: PhzF family phenazine biosynthesis protein [Pseudonocardiaceae bacterium]